MAHIGQELRLCAARGLGAVARLTQFGLDFNAPADFRGKRSVLCLEAFPALPKTHILASHNLLGPANDQQQSAIQRSESRQQSAQQGGRHLPDIDESLGHIGIQLEYTAHFAAGPKHGQIGLHDVAVRELISRRKRVAPVQNLA